MSVRQRETRGESRVPIILWISFMHGAKADVGWKKVEGFDRRILMREPCIFGILIRKLCILGIFA